MSDFLSEYRSPFNFDCYSNYGQGYGYPGYSRLRAQKSADISRYNTVAIGNSELPEDFGRSSEASAKGFLFTVGALAVGTFALLKKGKGGESLMNKTTGVFKKSAAKEAAVPVAPVKPAPVKGKADVAGGEKKSLWERITGIFKKSAAKEAVVPVAPVKPAPVKGKADVAGGEKKSLWERITGFFKKPTAKETPAPGTNAAQLTASQRAVANAEKLFKKGWQKIETPQADGTKIVTYKNPKGNGEIKLTYSKDNKLVNVDGINGNGKAIKPLKFDPQTGEAVKPAPKGTKAPTPTAPAATTPTAPASPTAAQELETIKNTVNGKGWKRCKSSDGTHRYKNESTGEEIIYTFNGKQLTHIELSGANNTTIVKAFDKNGKLTQIDTLDTKGNPIKRIAYDPKTGQEIPGESFDRTKK